MELQFLHLRDWTTPSSLFDGIRLKWLSSEDGGPYGLSTEKRLLGRYESMSWLEYGLEREDAR